MLLVIALVAGGLLLIAEGHGLFGFLLAAAGVWLMQHSRGDIVENLLAGMFGIVVIGGAFMLILELFG